MSEMQGVRERELTPAQLSEGVDAYFAACEEEKRRATLPGLCNALGISTETWEELRRAAEEGEGERADYLWPIRRAMQTLADALEQRTDSMASFLLKQPCFGRYGESEKAAAVGIRVIFSGSGAGAQEYGE